MVAVVFAAHMTSAGEIPPIPGSLPVCLLNIACLNLVCPNGIQLDVGGCQTCMCKDVCKGLNCPLPWWSMPKIDDTDVKKPNLTCVCGKYCEDNKGSEGNKECPKKCMAGYVKDEKKDCFTCECISPCKLRNCPDGLTVKADVDLLGNHVCVCLDINGILKSTLPALDGVDGLGGILGGILPKLPLPLGRRR